MNEIVRFFVRRFRFLFRSGRFGRRIRFGRCFRFGRFLMCVRFSGFSRPDRLPGSCRFPGCFRFSGIRLFCRFLRFHGCRRPPVHVRIRENLRLRRFFRFFRSGPFCRRRFPRDFHRPGKRLRRRCRTCPVPVPALSRDTCICILSVAIPIVQPSSSPFPAKIPTVYIISESVPDHKSRPGCLFRCAPL